MLKEKSKEIIELIQKNPTIPEFQRKVVWTEPQQRYLLETIFLDLLIPPLVISREYKQDKWIIIDGHQRFTSIKKFHDNKLVMKWTKGTINSSFVMNNNELNNIIKNTDGKSYSQLDLIYKNRFLLYELSYFALEDISKSKDESQEVFNRINTHSKTLTNQELRKSLYYSPNMINLYKYGLDIERNLIDNRILSKSQISRSADVELIMEMIIIEDNKELVVPTNALMNSLSMKMMESEELEFTSIFENILQKIKVTSKLITKSTGNNPKTLIKGKYYFSIVYYLLFKEEVDEKILFLFLYWLTEQKDLEKIEDFFPKHSKSIVSRRKSIDFFRDWRDTKYGKDSN